MAMPIFSLPRRAIVPPGSGHDLVQPLLRSGEQLLPLARTFLSQQRVTTANQPFPGLVQNSPLQADAIAATRR